MAAKLIDESEIAAILGYPAEGREALGLALGLDGTTAQSYGRAELEKVNQADLALARDIVREAYSTQHYAGAQNDFSCGTGATIVRLYRNRANRPPPRPRRPPPSGLALSDAEWNQTLARREAELLKLRRDCEHCTYCGRMGLNLDGTCPGCTARMAAAAAELEAVASK